ncbi:MAG: lectin-like protein [Pseudomonadota bacterium]
MSARTALLAAAMACTASSAAAIPVQWTTAAGGNGHWYEIIGGNFTQSSAIADAETRSYNGLDGYLATVASAEEMAFIQANLDLSSLPFISGTDEGREGTWVFNSGPETGTTMSYFNWSPGEPNNAGGTEDILHMWSNGTWNDHQPWVNITGYVIEYSGNVAPVPLPASAALLLAAFAGLGVAKRHRKA